VGVVKFFIRTATRIGRDSLALVNSLGQASVLFGLTLASLFTQRLRFRELLRQMHFVGVKSQFVVLTTGIFTGAVFAAQIQFQFARLGMESATGVVATIAMCRELGPVISALMIAGRVGSAMAAELATMKVTEQIDALRGLAVSPIDYLVVPRFLALVLSGPLLVGLAIGGGILAGYVVAVPLLGVEGNYYWDRITLFAEAKDVWIGIIKAFFFSVIIAVIACHEGLRVEMTTEAVGRATTDAAVNGSIAVLISNFFFTLILNTIFPVG
jgi:phospholipid/cholesterol/gamma-HCH transport system permease protein